MYHENVHKQYLSGPTYAICTAFFESQYLLMSYATLKSQTATLEHTINYLLHVIIANVHALPVLTSQ